MVRDAFLLFFVFLLTGCSSTLRAASPTAQEIALQPLASPTPVLSPTPTEIVLTSTPQATPTDSNFFRDDFNGQLEPQWSWVREDPANWSLVAFPGSLQINAVGGYVAQHTNFNLLLRAAPSGNFQIETQIRFTPQDNYQFAGLIIYESDSDFIQAGRSYCRTYECVGEGLYMNYYKQGHLVQPDFGQPYREIDPVLLRLTRQGNQYTFEASTDAKVWFIIGSHTSDLKPVRVGLVAGQNLKGHVLPALFEYFQVRSYP